MRPALDRYSIRWQSRTVDQRLRHGLGYPASRWPRTFIDTVAHGGVVDEAHAREVRLNDGEVFGVGAVWELCT